MCFANWIYITVRQNRNHALVFDYLGIINLNKYIYLTEKKFGSKVVFPP